MPRRRFSLGQCVLLGALVLACSCTDSGPKVRPNIVLVVLDTVRRDHVSAYGYPLPTTPHLDAFAAKADRYAQSWATAPWTLPSHASLFTGLYPFEHGARSGMDANGQYLDSIPLAPGHRTLAGVLAQEGYETAAFVANTGYLLPRLGLNQGFDTYEVERPPQGHQTSAKALAWLDARAAPPASANTNEARPFFLFVNYMDAHRPYNTTPITDARAPALPRPPLAQNLLDDLYVEVFEKDGPPSPELIRKVTEQYDTGIANVDLALGVLLKGLSDRGVFEDALVIVTSDHGEYLGEHDLVEHSKDVYEEALRVPLVVKHPGQTRGRVLDQRVSLANVPSLVIAELPRGMAKRHEAEFPNAPGQETLLAENEYSRAKDLQKPYRERFMRERSVLYLDDYKFILSSDGGNELFDLSRDPKEQENLTSQKRDLARTMEERLRGRLATSRPATAEAGPELTDEQRHQLRVLGYAGQDER